MLILVLMFLAPSFFGAFRHSTYYFCNILVASFFEFLCSGCCAQTYLYPCISESFCFKLNKYPVAMFLGIPIKYLEIEFESDL